MATEKSVVGGSSNSAYVCTRRSRVCSADPAATFVELTHRYKALLVQAAYRMAPPR